MVPDGCMDLLLDFSNEGAVRCEVVGAMTRPHMSLRTHLWGVRFKPGMMRPLLKSPASELTDLLVESGSVSGAEVHTLWYRVMESDAPEDAVAHLNAFLMAPLCGQDRDPRLNHAIHMLEEGLSVSHIGSQMGLSRQHLGRICRDYTGLTPKTLGQILRFQNALALQETCIFSLSDLAQSAGYFDQAHMNREFVRFTGHTPASFFAL